MKNARTRGQIHAHGRSVWWVAVELRDELVVVVGSPRAELRVFTTQERLRSSSRGAEGQHQQRPVALEHDEAAVLGAVIGHETYPVRGTRDIGHPSGHGMKARSALINS